MLRDRCAETGKAKYSLSEAEGARLRLHRRTDKKLDVFHCRACECWHVGHRPIGSTRASDRRQPRRLKRAQLTAAALVRRLVSDDA